MIDLEKLLTVVVQAGAFISAFAAIAAGILMARVTKKFGAGILVSGFRTISVGIFLVAIGIILDAAQVYLANITPQLITAIVGLRQVFFVLGTYIIVIGSKNTKDKLESLTK